MRISIKELQRILKYDPRTGALYWAEPRPKIVVGTRAGAGHPNGYRYIKLNGRTYSEHIIIWAWVTGRWPPRDLDHKNLKRADNRWRNLRLATRSQNQANARPRKAVGLKGTTRQRSGRWLAQIAFNKKKMALGTYDTTEQAHVAYMAKAKELYGDFARAK